MKNSIPLMIIALVLTLSETSSSQPYMRSYRSIFSVAGFFSTSHSTHEYDMDIGGPRIGGVTDQKILQLTSRDGYFIMRHLALGGECSWEHRSTAFYPDPNPLHFRSDDVSNRLFIGPWVRWYLPTGQRWYAALELSVGYIRQKTDREESTSAYVLPKTTFTTNGIGLNTGVAVGYMLRHGVALDLTGRYGAGWLNGERRLPGNPDQDLNLSFGEFHLLLGLQLLI